MTTVPDTSSQSDLAAATHDKDVVALTVPATASYLGVVRTATAGLAARLQFTLDEIEDLRMAVDEACTMLLRAAAPDGDLTCRFVMNGDAVMVDISVAAGDGEPLRPPALSWQVLTSLTTDVAVHNDDGRMALKFHKKRAT
jgi:serine/threonine-protein kinase RsbW